MNKKQIVGLTNILCILGTLLLVYWVFTFSFSTVFSIKVFRENLSQFFGISVLGILAVVISSLVLNIALNLTRIAETSEGTSLDQKLSLKKIVVCLLAPFPIIAGALYLGDQATTREMERLRVESARRVVAENDEAISSLANYSFEREFALKSGEILKIMSRENENFPSLSLIIADSINNRDVFLIFQSEPYWPKDAEKTRADFIYSSSAEEREYLKSVFTDGNLKERFTSTDNRYELYIPVQRQGKTMLLYFSEYAQYGKFGS